MKNYISTAICYMLVLTGCQQAEGIDNANEKLPLSIEASIEGNNFISRHITENNVLNMAFKVEDAIGVFVDNRPAVEWTKQEDGSWEAANTIYWPDKSNPHDFYAYHPYTAASSKESVPMPSLATQTGNIDNLCSLDFLVATKTQYYETSPTVSFIKEEEGGEDHSFKHVSSLISITIKGNSDLKSSTIKSISFSGGNIASATTYTFSTNSVTITNNETPTQIIAANINHSINNTDKTFYFVANAGEALSNTTINIEYSTGNKKYTASKTGLGNATLTGGTLYKFNMNITDGVIAITGNEITPWTEKVMDDIIINNPQESPNNENS